MKSGILAGFTGRNGPRGFVPRGDVSILSRIGFNRQEHDGQNNMAGFIWGDAYHAFRDLEQEVDRLLQNVGQWYEGVRFGRPYPPINVYDLEQEFLLTAEIPGTNSDDLEISVANGMVTIRGRRGLEGDVAEDRFRRSERIRGEWERSLPLPDRVLDEQMSAELKQGVLWLHLPKAPATQARQILVTEESRRPHE